MEYAAEVLGMSPRDTAIFREIALLSQEAVLKGKCCAVYDQRVKELPGYPTNQWMRDDVLHGLDRLEQPFRYLREVNGVNAALAEKAESVTVWRRMPECCEAFGPETDAGVRDVITASVEYGLRFFKAVESAWRALLPGWCLQQGEAVDPVEVMQALLDFLHFQGEDGNIPDGVVAEKKHDPYYKHFLRAETLPGRMAMKNSVSADQESSFVQAMARMCGPPETGASSPRWSTVKAVWRGPWPRWSSSGGAAGLFSMD